MARSGSKGTEDRKRRGGRGMFTWILMVGLCMYVGCDEGASSGAGAEAGAEAGTAAAVAEVAVGEPLVTDTRDSAGIRIVENARPAEDSRLPWRIGTEPAASIGEIEGDEPYILHEVTDAVLLPDRRIVVANSGTNEIRLYDAEGDHQATHRGEPPICGADRSSTLPATSAARSESSWTKTSASNPAWFWQAARSWDEGPPVGRTTATGVMRPPIPWWPAMAPPRFPSAPTRPWRGELLFGCSYQYTGSGDRENDPHP